MFKRKYIGAVFLTLFVFGKAEGSITSTTTAFLKLHDKLLVSQNPEFISASISSGLDSILSQIRVIHACLLSREQPADISPMVVLKQRCRTLTTIGVGFVEGYISMMDADLSRAGSSLDILFSSSCREKTENLIEKLKSLLNRVNEIFSQNSVFLNISSQLGLIEEYQQVATLVNSVVSE